MTDKVYIVVNEEQEQEVLDKVYKKGKMWPSQDGRGNYWSPVHKYVEFPYVIVDCGKRLIWTNIDRLTDEEIVFDGRKEDKMSEKYIVSQDFMDKLEDWKEILRLDNVLFIGRKALSNLPNLLDKWWRDGSVSVHESNNRLIAIIRWVNGEDIFEVEKPKKWIVRSKGTDDEDNYSYVFINLNNFTLSTYHISNATKFDTKEEAESWANSHQEVVEVDE